MRKIKKLILITIIIISLFTVFIVNGVIESISVNKQIVEFKARGKLVYENDSLAIYHIVPKYDYEDLSRPVVRNIYDKRIGAKGDIFVTSRNPIRDNPIMEIISELTWVGHSGIIIDDDGEQTIEITGNRSPEDNVVKIYDNDWVSFNDKKTKQIALLRVKNTTEEERNQMIEYAKSQLGKPYNYTLLLNRAHTFYCSDLVSRSVASAGININYDYLATTGSDMFVSNNTYLVYYREVIDGKIYIYYLTEEE